MVKTVALRFTPCIFALLLCLHPGQAQRPQNIENLRATEEARAKDDAKIREQDDRFKKMAEMSIEKAKENGVAGDAFDYKVLYGSENELPPEEKKLLAVEEDELTKYAAFLKQVGTGIFKLLPFRENKIAINDVRTQIAYPKIRGAGTYFSFTKRNHIADEWAQMRLVGNRFLPGYFEMKRTTVAQSGGMTQSFTYTSGYSLAIFSELGDLALESLTENHEAYQYLQKVTPPVELADFQKQIQQYRNGITQGNAIFRTNFEAKPNTTFLLRSILYKRTDALIALRVLKQDDANGSLIILWKILQTFPTPELKGKPQNKK